MRLNNNTNKGRSRKLRGMGRLSSCLLTTIRECSTSTIMRIYLRHNFHVKYAQIASKQCEKKIVTSHPFSFSFFSPTDKTENK